MILRHSIHLDEDVQILLPESLLEFGEPIHCFQEVLDLDDACVDRCTGNDGGFIGF